MGRDRVHFGVYEVDLGLRELRRRGVLVHVPEKAFALLEALLERPGETASRDELRRRLWPGTHVEFDHGLNNAVSRLRAALRDDAYTSRFVETVPGRGYRFVAPVGAVPAGADSAKPPWWRGWRAPAVGTAVAVALLVAWGTRPKTIAEATSPGRVSYLVGQYHYARQYPGSLLEARRHFQEALAQDPSLAPAHAALARTALRLARWRLGPRQELEATARKAARRATELDALLPEARLASGEVHAWLDCDWKAAETEIGQAIRLNPRSHAAFEARAELLASLGRIEEATRAIDRASALAPLSFSTHALAGRLRYFARRHDAAIGRLQLALDMEPEFPPAHKWLSDAYWQLGNGRVAASELEAWLRSLGIGAPELARVHGTIGAHGLAGLWRENARRSEGVYSGGDGIAFKVATFYAPLGDSESTVRWLERALEEGDHQLLATPLDPTFDRVREAPRFRAFLRQMEETFRLPHAASGSTDALFRRPSNPESRFLWASW